MKKKHLIKWTHLGATCFSAVVMVRWYSVS